MRRMAVHGESFDPTKMGSQEVQVVPKTRAQREAIEENLNQIFLFQNLDTDQFEGAVNALYEKRVVPGENILNFGDEGNLFFIIQKGTFKSYCMRDGQEILQRCYVDRGHFGELYLLYGEPVDIRVTAATDGILWCLDRKSYKQIVLGIRAKKLADFDKYLDEISTLSDLTPGEKNRLVSLVETMTINSGEQIVEQGERQNGMYVLLKGSVRFKQKLNNGDTAQWTEEKIGLHFGERSLVSKCWWPYTIIAENKTEVAYLPLEAVESSLGPLKL